nr:putative integron gene cassette protein [uncultured bacterium]
MSDVRRHMGMIGVQMKQTLISTGAVGACFGLVAVAGLPFVQPGSNARLAAQGLASPHWTEVALSLAFVFLTLTVGAIVLFGLLPALLGKLVGFVIKRLRGAA